MIFLGYFVDGFLSLFFSKIFFEPCLFLVFSMFRYFRHKTFDAFLWEAFFSLFFAHLFLGISFFRDFSFLVLFSFLLFLFAENRKTPLFFFLFTFLALVTYPIYLFLLYFFLQFSFPLAFLWKTISRSLLFNLIVTFFLSFFFRIKKKSS